MKDLVTQGSIDFLVSQIIGLHQFPLGGCGWFLLSSEIRELSRDQTMNCLSSKGVNAFTAPIEPSCICSLMQKYKNAKAAPGAQARDAAIYVMFWRANYERSD